MVATLVVWLGVPISGLIVFAIAHESLRLATENREDRTMKRPSKPRRTNEAQVWVVELAYEYPIGVVCPKPALRYIERMRHEPICEIPWRGVELAKRDGLRKPVAISYRLATAVKK